MPSGEKVFDWIIPQEWNIRDAYIIDPQGEKIVDFKVCNLHVVGYSTAIDAIISLEELQSHLYSLPEQPDAIPYIVSYYEKRWGFCLKHELREALKPGLYRVKIDSVLENGHLTYGEIILPGKTSAEIFLSTYVCHPSMGNNELSGPTVATKLVKWVKNLQGRKHTYRIVFIPETIGAITYLNKNLDYMKKHIFAGFNLTCVGDDRAYSYLPSRAGNTQADTVALHTLRHLAPDFISYTYLDRGSDERQYCSPGVDLPVVSIMRSKYHIYPEYHTSKDDLSVISPEGLYGAYNVLRHCLMCLERNEKLKVTVLCEPQLSPRGLYPTISTKNQAAIVAKMMDLLAYCDGTRDLLDIAETIKQPMWELFDIVDSLKAQGLLTTCPEDTV